MERLQALKFLALAVILAGSAAAQPVTVFGTLVGPGGDRLSGSCSATASATFVAADGFVVAPALPVTVRFNNGAMAFPLEPNDTGNPEGTTYNVSCVAPQQTVTGVDGRPHVSQGAWGPWVFSVPTPSLTSYSVTGATWSGGIATLTVGSHSVVANQYINVSSVTPSGYNATFAVVTSVTSTTVSYAVTTNPGTYTSGGTLAGARGVGIAYVLLLNPPSPLTPSLSAASPITFSRSTGVIGFDSAADMVLTGYWDFSDGSWRPPESTVLGLPSAAVNPGREYRVVDAVNAQDCTVGGGTSVSICRSNGVAWIAIGGGVPFTTLGDTLYGGASGTATRLPGNTTTSNKFLRQVGNGTVSAAPSWESAVESLSAGAGLNQAGTASNPTVEVDSSQVPYKYTLSTPGSPTMTVSGAMKSDLLIDSESKAWICLSDSGDSWARMLLNSVTAADIDDGAVDAATKLSGIVPSANMQPQSFGATFSGGGAALASGTTAGVSLVYIAPLAHGCTARAWTITVDTGTVGFRVWRKSSSTTVPTVADTITTADLAISAGSVLNSTTFTNFTGGTAPVFDAGDSVAIQLNATAAATYASFSIQCR